MFKLLFTAIAWFFFSSGPTTVPNMLVTIAEVQEDQASTPDTHCKRGHWPDRARACAAAEPAKIKLFRVQGVEKLVDIKQAQTAATAPAGGIRIFDASTAAAPAKSEQTPVAAASDATGATYSLAGTTTEAPKALTRTFRPAVSAVDVAGDEAAPTIERRRPAARPAQRRNGGYASYRPQGMVRVLGVAF